MISEAEFAELGNSLLTGFFIDRVIMSLARTQRLGQLGQEDQPLIDQASQLLRQVLEGERWLDVKQFNGQSAESALAFDRAVTALPLHIRAPKEFTEYITGLEQITNTLLEHGSASAEEIREVRDFFSRYGRKVFTEAQNVIERSGKPEGLQLWTQRE